MNIGVRRAKNRQEFLTLGSPSNRLGALTEADWPTTVLELRFFNDTPPESKQVSGEAFLFDRAGIHERPGGELVAQHVRDHWLVGGDLFLKLECRGAVECLIDQNRRAQQREGPFDRVALIDGVLTADERPLAILNERRGWCSLIGDENWIGFRLVPSSACLVGQV